MLSSKRDIRRRIAEGELKPAAEAALAYAEYCGSADTANQLTALQSRLSEHGNQWNTGQISYEEFSRAQAKIAYDLTAIADDLPDHPAPNAAKRPLTDETTFKKRLFYFLCASKLAVLAAAWHQFSTGGFDMARLLTVVGLLAPLFVTYITIMLGDYLRQQRDELPPRRRYVSGPLVTFAYVLFPLYTLSMLYAIRACAGGSEVDLYQVEDLTKLFALIETLLGVYVGQIVGAFFKKE